MDWITQIKKAPVQYSGTCKRCGEFVMGGQECPKKLAAQVGESTDKDYCPQRTPKPSTFLDRARQANKEDPRMGSGQR